MSNLHEMQRRRVLYFCNIYVITPNVIFGPFPPRYLKTSTFVFAGIVPETHSPGMFSWFPIFFPIKVRFYVNVLSLDLLLSYAALT